MEELQSDALRKAYDLQRELAEPLRDKVVPEKVRIQEDFANGLVVFTVGDKWSLVFSPGQALDIAKALRRSAEKVKTNALDKVRKRKGK